MPVFSSIVAARPPQLLLQDCVLCGEEGARIVCTACERRLPPAGPASVEGCERVVAALAYRFPVDALVAKFKFAGDLAIGAWLAERLAERVRGEAQPDALIPTPLAPARLRVRGFNQAMEIARVVGRERGVPVVNGLARARDTEPQPGLGRLERRRNLEGAFRAVGDFTGLSVAIVDDVVTTGATAEALAMTLRAAGARHVSLWACARTPAPEDARCSR